MDVDLKSYFDTIPAMTDGFDFLDYHFQHGERFPRAQSLTKLKDSIREKTRRNNGCCLAAIVHHISATRRGWFGYFQHVTKSYVFTSLDKGIRGRLRSLLRRRQKRRGRARGRDQQRWPNSFFAVRGLYSLTTAYDTVRQSSVR